MTTDTYWDNGGKGRQCIHCGAGRAEHDFNNGGFCASVDYLAIADDDKAFAAMDARLATANQLERRFGLKIVPRGGLPRTIQDGEGNAYLIKWTPFVSIKRHERRYEVIPLAPEDNFKDLE